MSNKTQIFINDISLDLSSDSPIALSFAINDLGNPRNQQGNTSNQFQIPNTQNNRKALGFPDDINFYDPSLQVQLPYTKYKVRVIQNNIEILPNAIAELGDPAFDSNQFNLTVLSGNVDFFDQIGGNLADMGDSTSQWSNYGANLVWKPYDHVWNLQNAATSQNNTADSGNNGIGGWIYPIVDYGLMSDDITQRIDVRFLRPGFFIKTAIDLLLKFTKYKGVGKLLTNPLYPKLIAQFSNGTWEHGIDYQNQKDTRGMAVEQTGMLNYIHNTDHDQSGIIPFNTVISDPGHQFNGADTFTSAQINDVIITIKIPKVYLKGRVTPNDKSSKIKILITITDGITVAQPAEFDFSFDGFPEKLPTDHSSHNGWRRISGSGGTIYGDITILNSTFSYQTVMSPGMTVLVEYTFSGLGNSAFAPIVQAIIYGGMTFTVKSQNQTVQFGQVVQCERIFPDVSQKDLLKDMLQRFGIICQTDDYSATINFASLGEIIGNIPIAKDWSEKVLNQGKQVSTKIGSYSQVNYLEYQVDPNGGLTQIPLKFAWSQINVNDKTLSVLASDLIVSIFGASLNRSYIGGQTALIQMVDPADSAKAFSISVAPRILIDNKVDLIALGKSVTFTDDDTSDPTDIAHNITVNDKISCPYFWKDGVTQDMSLLWNDLRLLYYKELEVILNNCKKITLYFILSARDISELDLLIPIYLQHFGAYFYINKIDSWIENVPVKVELIKIG